MKLTADSLRQLLCLAGYDPDILGWGTGEAKGVENLVEELENGESCLVIRKAPTGGIQIVRVLRVVRMDILDKDNRTLLHESTKMPDGRLRKLHRRPSGKMGADESPLQALIREMGEEIKLQENHYRSTPGEVVFETAPSKSYPGLPCEYEVHPFTIIPDPVWLARRPDGFETEDEDQILRFEWCKNFVPETK